MIPNSLKTLGLRLVARGLHAPENPLDRFIEFSRLKSLLDTLRINCVLDVGANDGQFAKNVRAIGYDGLIISFEPIREVFDKLSQTFVGDSRWRGVPIALGKMNGNQRLNVHKMSVLSSFLETVEPTDGVEVREVELRTLASLLPDLIKDLADPRVFLKMDTQGFDHDVFEGAANMACIRALMSEIAVSAYYKGQKNYVESFEIYRQAGYVLHHLSVVNRTPEGDLRELNAYFRRIG